MYVAGIFLTLGYDTIYAHQDIDDDLSIGVKSTAILFGNNTKYWVASFYSLMTLSLCIFGIISSQKLLFFLFLVTVVTHQLLQISKLDIKSSKVCLALFKSNQYLGLLICLALLSSYI